MYKRQVEGKLNFAVGGIVPRSHGGYTAVRSQNANFVAADYTADATGNLVATGNIYPMEDWPSGRRYLSILIPNTSDDLTHIYQNGDPFRQEYLGSLTDTGVNDRVFAKQASTITVGGVVFKQYNTTQPFEFGYSESSWDVT